MDRRPGAVSWRRKPFRERCAVVIDRFVIAVAGPVACLLLAACGAMDTLSTSAKGSGAGVQAVLRPAVQGVGQADVRFVDRGNGVLVTVFFTNLPPGTYRIAIHQNPNCGSPNLFSAGPAWAPAGSPRTDGDATLETQIPGVHTTGPDSLQGRSVVLHAGLHVGAAVPNVPNDRVMCGVIGPALSFLS
jgi:Cu/Zn superoxide dismutase